MSTRSIQILLWTVSGLFAVAAVATLVAAVVLPVRHESADAGWLAASADEATAAATPPSLPPLDSFAAIWEKGVPAPSPDAPAEPVEYAPVSSEPPPLQLLATAVEHGRSTAVVLDEQGVVRVRGVGESVAGATITRIEPGRVEIDHGGRRVTLELPVAAGTAEIPHEMSAEIMEAEPYP